MDIWHYTMPDGRQAYLIVVGSNTENVWPSFIEWLKSHGIQPYIDHKGRIILAELPAEAAQEGA